MFRRRRRNTHEDRSHALTPKQTLSQPRRIDPQAQDTYRNPLKSGVHSRSALNSIQVSSDLGVGQVQSQMLPLKMLHEESKLARLT